MRTKTILTAAAVLAAGALTSMAQSNVFSLNVVGYYNIQTVKGFQMIANQLDLDGTGVNNTLQSVFGTQLPSASKIFVFSGGAFTATATVNASGNWLGNTNAANLLLQPGKGAFLQIPASAASAPSVTFVGNVLQGTESTPYNTGYNIVSAHTPRSGGVQTVLGLTPSSGDFVFQFNPGTQSVGTKHTSNGTTWLGGEPTPGIGESFWYNAKVAKSWSETFTVN